MLAARSWLPDLGNDVLLSIFMSFPIWGLALGPLIFKSDEGAELQIVKSKTWKRNEKAKQRRLAEVIAALYIIYIHTSFIIYIYIYIYVYLFIHILGPASPPQCGRERAPPPRPIQVSKKSPKYVLH